MTLEEFTIFCGEQANKVKAKRLKAEQFAKDRKRKEMMSHKLNEFGVRKCGDHVESYIKATGEVFYSHRCESDAWRDLEEEFGGN